MMFDSRPTGRPQPDRSSPVYAIVEDSGTQIKLSQGAILDVDLREGANAAGDTITFDRVLAIKADGADTATIGAPYLDGVTVSAEVIGEGKGEKIDVIKFKRRKNYRRKQGHRQRYLRIRVGEIGTRKKAAAKKATTKKSVAKKATTKKPTAKKATTKKPTAKKATTKAKSD